MHRCIRSFGLAKLICLLVVAAWIPAAEAADYAVTVSRDAQNWYVDKLAYRGVIKTRSCFEFVFFDNAILRLTTPNTGTLIFSSGQQCSVVNVFDPASLSAGNYSAFVDSNGDGYYELTDGSYLFKALGFDFAFGSSATIFISSAINGLAFGTIAVANSFANSLTNIYQRRSVVVPPPSAPNLTISSFTVVPTAVSVGGTVTVAATVKNVGSASSGATTLRYYYSTGGSFAEIPGCAEGIGALTPNGTTNQTCLVTVSSAGDLIVGVGVDAVSGELITTDNISSTIKVTVISQGVVNFGGMWWNSPAQSEAGWGVNFAHQGDTIFATWFTFGADGKPLWLVVAATKTSSNVYTGKLFTATGPAFNAVPFDPAKVIPVEVGTAIFTFIDGNNATFAYTVNGISQTKPITREVFSSPMPVCTWGAQPNLALATAFQDMWWNFPAQSEAGWGINFAQQGDTIFATWFTFGLDGKPLWLVVAANKTAPNTYAGNLFTATGPAFNAIPFDPKKVIPSQVGTATLVFTNGNAATFTYTFNGVSQSKQITREVFAPPGTVCQ